MGPSSASRPSPRGLGPPITPQSSNYTIMNLELLVVFLDEPVLVHTRTFELWAKKDVSQDVLGQAEDPEVVPPTQEGDRSCSSRGSRSCSSCPQRRAKDLILPRRVVFSRSLWTRDPLTRSRRIQPRKKKQRRRCKFLQDPR